MSDTNSRSNLRAKFFKDGEQDMVEISIVGDSSTSLQKVVPQHLAMFAPEWAAYQDGIEHIDHGGTPLTEVPGLDKGMETAYRLKGVNNVEQFVSLSEAAVKSLGMGAITFWKTAKLLMASKEAEAVKDLTQAPRRGRPPNAKPDDTEVAA